ncbi:EPIDERMAL PATTERNING FACTOR-like protein 2 isoform X1 [Prosopis cineraria]|uniref:EPIDERMAL PATTERNING FACTOR-like protein 2 isoform X1 n=2 Tax=Prosopis cineraria TaxID=364024 RepID=UPI00240FA536|nr:EPIDERMAL PATTERNING FACTOR-like protein 2 isoform X1 [Prosopis cineraria]
MSVTGSLSLKSVPRFCSRLSPSQLFHSTGFCEMGHDHQLICGHRLSFIIFSLLFLLVSSWTQQGFLIESRKTLKQNGFEQVVVSEDDATSVRARIGSRPPKCEGRCSWCGHCEAIQVPTNPQVQKEEMNTAISAYGRGDESTTSNYKPMSWKCKCGNLIFNP